MRELAYTGITMSVLSRHRATGITPLTFADGEMKPKKYEVVGHREPL